MDSATESGRRALSGRLGALVGCRSPTADKVLGLAIYPWSNAAMQFRQLEYLTALARERHFARAAAACHVSQPALSEAIRKLEHELDVALVQRGRTFHGFTPEGERVAVWARRILAEHDALKHEVSALRSGLVGQLRIGVIPAATTTVALLTDPFCSVHPLARVQIDSGLASNEIQRRLRAFELDAGISYVGEEDTAGLTVTPLYHERMVLVGARDVLPDGDSLTWAEVCQLPLCLQKPSLRGRQLVDAVLDDLGLSVVPQIEADSVASMYAHAATGRWASLVPHSWGNAFRIPADLRAIAIDGPQVGSSVGLVTSADEPGSVLARALVEVVRRLRLDHLLARGPLIVER